MNEALQGAEARARRRRSQTAALGDMAAAARKPRTPVALMPERPERMSHAVYPWLPHGWPDGKSADQVLADCRTYLARERARAGHWSHDPDRIVALLHAEAALSRMAHAGDRPQQAMPSPSAAARGKT